MLIEFKTMTREGLLKGMNSQLKMKSPPFKPTNISYILRINFKGEQKLNFKDSYIWKPPAPKQTFAF